MARGGGRRVALAVAGIAVAAGASMPYQQEDARFVMQPPLVCPVVSLKGINTLFIHAGPMTGEADSLRAATQALVVRYNGSDPAAANNGINAAAGAAAVSAAGLPPVVGSFSDTTFLSAATIPSPAQLAAADIVVYMDMLGADAAPETLEACQAMGEALNAWFTAREGRDIVVDGRALSMTTAELAAEWTQLATRTGGLLLWGHSGAHQACLASAMPALGLLALRPDAALPGYPVPIPANERAPLWMCPTSGLTLHEQTFNTFGRLSRYVVSGGRGGGLVPAGVQPSGLYIAGMAYYDGDLARPAVSSSITDDTGKQALRGRITGPPDGSYSIRSCDPVVLSAEITTASGAPPYTLQWLSSASSAPADVPPAVIAMASFGAGDVATLPLAISHTVQLRNGTHRLRLRLSDTEGSIYEVAIMLAIQDSSVGARNLVALVEGGRAIREAAYKNLTDKIAATRADTAANEALKADLVHQRAARTTAVDEAEAAATSAAADVGALTGQIAAFESIHAEQVAALATLRAETINEQRTIGDLSAQRTNYEAQVSALSNDAAALEALRIDITDLQAREAELKSRLASATTAVEESKQAEAAARAAAGEAAANATTEAYNLQVQIAGAKTKREEAESAAATAAARLVDLRAQLAAATKDAGELSAAVAPTTAAVRDARTRLATARASLADLIAQAAGSDATIANARLAAAALFASAGMADDAERLAAGDIDPLAVNKGGLAARLAALENATVAQEAAAASVARAAGDGDTAVAKLTAEAGTLADAVAEQEAEATRNARARDATWDAAHAAAADTSALGADVAAALTASSSLASALTDARARHAAATAAADAAEKEFASLQRDLRRWTALADDLDTAAKARAASASASASVATSAASATSL